MAAYEGNFSFATIPSVMNRLRPPLCLAFQCSIRRISQANFVFVRLTLIELTLIVTTTTTTITSSSNIYAPVSCHAIKQSPLLVHYFLSGLTFIMMVMTMVVQLHCLYPTLLFYSSKRKSVMQMAQSLLVGHYLTKAYMIDWQGILKQENN